MTDRAAFLFDMDGVILDSTAVHVEAWQAYLREHEINVPDLAARMLGKHNAELVRDFFTGRPLSDDDVKQHGARKEQMYRDLMDPRFERSLVPGIREFLRRHRGVAMGIATNAEPANVDFVLERAGIRDCFAAVVNGDEVENPKPAPDIYQRVASLLGAPASGCIVFEDSATGVQAARAAGMRVVGLATTVPHLEGADLVVRDFHDPRLEKWLQHATAA